MTDKITGFLEVGLNDKNEIILNHPAPLEVDDNGIGHFVFSANQAKNLAKLLLKHAAMSEDNEMEREAAARRKTAEQIPVDRSQRVLVNGQPVTDDHRDINPATGMQKDYIVLTPEERAKGFVRPVRNAYVHVGKPPEGEDYSRFRYPIRGDVKPFPGGCLTRTQFHRSIAETFARDPGFYSGGGFCCSCRRHVPNEELIWEGTTEMVSS